MPFTCPLGNLPILVMCMAWCCKCCFTKKMWGNRTTWALYLPIGEPTNTRDLHG